MTFCIWVVNTSPYTSAFNVVLRDVLYNELLAYVSGQSIWAGSTSGASICVGRGRDNAGTEVFDWTCGGASPCACEPPDGQTYPYYLRWAINVIGPAGKSALICFKMRIL